MSRDRLWSTAEIEQLQTLMASGMRRAEIAVVLKRSLKGVDGKLQYIALTDEQRDERRRALRRRRNAEHVANAPRTHANAQVIVSSRPRFDVLEERSRRESAPVRDLTAAFFGDPPVGYSALERRA